MTECSAQRTLGFHPQLPIRVDFDAPEISSDGGALLLRQLDDRLELTAGFAACLPDQRDPTRVVHDRHEQSRQRLYQIALGYEDCNDADTLRHDPLLKTVCDRTPKDPVGLSSQPTLSRFENAPDGLTIRRLTRWLERSYVDALPASTEVIVLDIDATDDETHGQQQLSFFHGFYDHHIYHPLMVYDGESGQLISAILRPGNTHASRGALGVVRRIIRRLRQRFPEVTIVVRGDAGFAMPRLMEELENLGVDYLFGIAKNARLKRFAAPAMHWVEELFERLSTPVKRYTSFDYAARSWPQTRRIIAKAEHSALGPNPRFVVTSLEGFDPETIYRAYVQRGLCEHWIKDFKCALAADRLSCSNFAANSFRLLLHAAAYRLLHALRREVAPVSPELGRAQFDTLRLRLLKVAALVRQSLRRVWVRLPRAYPWRHAFAWLVERMNAPPLPA
jgi:hypothetical protein